MTCSLRHMLFFAIVASAPLWLGCDDDTAGSDLDVATNGEATQAGGMADGAGGAMAADGESVSGGEIDLGGASASVDAGSEAQTASSGEAASIDAEEGGADAPTMSQQRAVEVSLRLQPDRAYYRDIDHPNASLEALDASGAAIINPAIVWQIVPDGIAEISGAGALSFLQEGQGNIEGCVDGVCDSVTFVVDFGPPDLDVVTPLENHMASGASGLLVSGTVTDSSPSFSLTINETSVDVAEDGSFSVEVPAAFGINKVEIEANDGITAPARVVRNVIWAPRYLPAGEGSVDIGPAIALRLDQAMVDDGGSSVLPEGAGTVDISSLATLIESMLGLVDFNTLLGSLDLGLNSEQMTVELGTLTVGNIDAQIEVVGDAADGQYPYTQGLYLVVKLDDVSIDVSGEIQPDLGSANSPDGAAAGISVSGRIATSISLYSMLDIAVTDGAISVVGAPARVVVEPLEATGVGDEDEASPILALLTAEGSGLAGPLEETVANEVGGLMDDLAPIIETALTGLIGALGDVPLNFEAPYEGAQPVELAMTMNPSSVEYLSNQYLRLFLDGNISSARILATQENDRGVPAMAAENWVEVQGDGLGISVSADLFNALLHEVWRSGILTINLNNLPTEAQLIGIMGAAVDAKLPPIIVPKPDGGEFPMALQVAALRVELTKVGAAAADVYTVNLTAGLRVLFQSGDDGVSKLRLELSSEPDIVVELAEDNSGAALAPSLLSTLFGILIWPEIEGLLTDSLDLGLQPSQVGLETLNEFIPRAESLTVYPQLDGALMPAGPRLKVEGDLGMSLNVCDDQGVCP